jgi:hypothetical protein
MAGDPSIHVNITQGWISGEYQGLGYTQYKGKPQLVDDGRIDTIYGGGDQAKVIGSTHIYIADSTKVTLESLKGLKQKINAILPPNEPKLTMGSITIEFGTNDNTIKYSGTGTGAVSISQPIEQPVKGATINGNVYGGGNQADVTGSTYIQIGPDSAPIQLPVNPAPRRQATPQATPQTNAATESLRPNSATPIRQ